MVGVIGALEPRLLIAVSIAWFAVLVLTGYVGLASMLAGAALVAFVYAGSSRIRCRCSYFAPSSSSSSIFTHRAQHRTHALGKGAPGAQAMAVSFPDRVDPPALLAAARGRRGCIRACVWRASSERQPRRSREGWCGVCAPAVRSTSLPAAARLQLPAPVELLDARQASEARWARRCARDPRLEVLFDVDSTNTRLLGLAPPPPGARTCARASFQHAGRGAAWAPLGLSFRRQFGPVARLVIPGGRRSQSGLEPRRGRGDFTGAATARRGHVRLKWPNDIWFGRSEDRRRAGRTACGSRRAGPSGDRHRAQCVAVGRGSGAPSRRAAQRACASRRSRRLPGESVPQVLAATLLEELLSMLGEFERRDSRLSRGVAGARCARRAGMHACLRRRRSGQGDGPRGGPGRRVAARRRRAAASDSYRAR